MNIASAKFIKGVVGEDEILSDSLPQVAFVGRSNVGKSSAINALTGQKGLAKTSSFPGRTRQINVFLVSSGKNNSFYLVDLPGYGFAKGSKEEQEKIQMLVHWYLFDSGYEQKKVALIIDAVIGLTQTDFQMLYSLKEAEKSVVIIANKVDKLKNSRYLAQLNSIKELVGDFKVFPFSAEKKIGVSELINELFF